MLGDTSPTHARFPAFKMAMCYRSLILDVAVCEWFGERQPGLVAKAGLSQLYFVHNVTPDNSRGHGHSMRISVQCSRMGMGHEDRGDGLDLRTGNRDWTSQRSVRDVTMRNGDGRW